MKGVSLHKVFYRRKEHKSDKEHLDRILREDQDLEEIYDCNRTK